MGIMRRSGVVSAGVDFPPMMVQALGGRAVSSWKKRWVVDSFGVFWVTVSWSVEIG